MQNQPSSDSNPQPDGIGESDLQLDGRVLGNYNVVARLGRGGMGVVYKAHDNRLNRDVALKVLPSELVSNETFKRRFIQEARAASALNHPNIVTIHDINTADGIDFMVMELVPGITLAERLRTGPLPIVEVPSCALQIADALARAHSKAIVHRDLKPANIMLTPEGQVKVLDFGIAKLMQEDRPTESTLMTLTEKGVILGTAAYMSPEQVEGKSLDPRSDIFSFGSVLYEMVSGKRAFEGESSIAIISSVIRSEPVPLRQLSPAVPAGLEELVVRCLRKKPEERIQSMDEIKASLQRIWNEVAPARTATLPGKRVIVAVSVFLIILLGAVIGFWRRSQNIVWAHSQSSEIRRLISNEEYLAALTLSKAALSYIPEDSDLKQLMTDASWESSVNSQPPGASVFVRPYGSPDEKWISLGATPITPAQIPRGPLEWKFSKPEFQELHRVTNATTQRVADVRVVLASSKDVPEGMIYIPAAPSYGLSLDGLFHLPPFKIPAFYIDKFEVTNRQFKEFVEKGGYSRREFWKQPFMLDGKEIPWEKALDQFRDKTGQPGPATWEFKEYPMGQEDYPVSGVSWYEAAAYAEFAEKSLPPLPLWNIAARPELIPHLVVPLSNFDGKGLRAVSASKGLNAFGTFDMAGNVKEWCWNESGEVQGQGERFIEGGSWVDQKYVFGSADARKAFDRSASNGIRLVKFIDKPDKELMAPLIRLFTDYVHAKVATDSEFKTYARLYAYDKLPLNSVVESSKEEPYWTKQKITFDAAYNNERMVAYLFLPKNASPPFQTMVYFPGLNVQVATNSSDLIDTDIFSFLVRSGRAVIYPIYKGTYERGTGQSIPRGTMAHRDSRIEQFKDFGRSIDYLETRNDIDLKKIGFYGISWGGGMGAQFPALEDRIKLSVLVHAGLRMEPALPEVDQINFVTRVKVPTLMLSGIYDFDFRPETSQIPMFDLLGTPAADKKRITYEVGHQFLPEQFPKDALPWLDKYFGPVIPVTKKER